MFFAATPAVWSCDGSLTAGTAWELGSDGCDGAVLLGEEGDNSDLKHSHVGTSQEVRHAEWKRFLRKHDAFRPWWLQQVVGPDHPSPPHFPEAGTHGSGGGGEGGLAGGLGGLGLGDGGRGCGGGEGGKRKL